MLHRGLGYMVYPTYSIIIYYKLKNIIQDLKFEVANCTAML